MSIKEFYGDIKKNAKANTELNQLYKKPIPETKKYMPIAQVFEKDVYYQADVLYMPKDGDYKFILVCTDMYDNTIDAEQMKEVNVENVLKAFKKMFKRKYLNYPEFITFDKGNEFHGEQIINYFKKNKTNVKYALTGRHRQVANVERANQKISEILFKRMTSQELLTGEPSTEWVDDLKGLIEVLNENKKTPLKKEISDIPIVDAYSGKLFKIGQKVRLLLDYPINNTNHARLNGIFRTTDTRWTNKIYKITEILLKPGNPPMYLTDIDDNVARTKNQLSKVRNNEEEPKAQYIRGNPEHYIISKILNKKVENRKTYYLTKFKGYTDAQATWEQASIFNRTKDLQKMRKKYNDEH
jgi:hypothetical protein